MKISDCLTSRFSVCFHAYHSTPIAFVLGLAGVIALVGSSGGSLLMLVPQQIFSGMNSFVLMAIPFFILAGELMNAAGITGKIVNLSNALVGRMKGGSGMST